MHLTGTLWSRSQNTGLRQDRAGEETFVFYISDAWGSNTTQTKCFTCWTFYVKMSQSQKFKKCNSTELLPGSEANVTCTRLFKKMYILLFFNPFLFFVLCSMCVVWMTEERKPKPNKELYETDGKISQMWQFLFVRFFYNITGNGDAIVPDLMICACERACLCVCVCWRTWKWLFHFYAWPWYPIRWWKSWKFTDISLSYCYCVAWRSLKFCVVA